MDLCDVVFNKQFDVAQYTYNAEDQDYIIFLCRTCLIFFKDRNKELDVRFDYYVEPLGHYCDICRKIPI